MNLINIEPSTSKWIPQTHSTQNKNIFKFYLNQGLLTNFLLTKRDTAAWRLYFKTAGDRDIISKAKTKVMIKPQFRQKFKMYHTSGGPDKMLYFAGRGIQEFIALKSFRLELVAFYSKGNTVFHNFSEVLKRCHSSLQNLDLCFSDNPFLNDKSLEILSKGLKVHISLEKITLRFSEYDQITDQGIQNLCKGLKHLIFLQSLRLSFTESQLVTDKGLLCIRKLLCKLKNLREVDLDFRYSLEISVKGVERMIKNLKSDNLLQQVSIGLYTESCGVILGGIAQQDFKSSIFFKVKVCLQGTKEESNDLKSLLKTMPPVQSLTLKFKELREIKTFEWKFWIKTLETLTSLQSINFKFSRDSEIADEDLKKISSSLKGFEKIKDLSFEFSRHNRVSEKGFRHFSKALEGLCLLQNLSLDFSGCYQIDASGVKFLVQSLKKLNRLEEFLLKVGRNCAVGREEIFETLKGHKSLQIAKIDFGNGDEIVEVWKHRNEDQGQEQQSIGSYGLFAGILNFLKKTF